MTGDPKYMGTQYIPNVPYARYAELLGLKGIYCNSADTIGAAWDEAFATTDRPVLLEVKVDQETPPLPPHITLEQATHMMSALVGDEPERWGIIKKSLKGKAVEFSKTLRSSDESD